MAHKANQTSYKKGHKQINTGRTRWKKGMISTFKGKQHTEKAKRLQAEASKGNTSFKNHRHTTESINKLKKSLKFANKHIKHHLYLSKNSDKVIIMTNSTHSKIHWKAYDYIYAKYGKKGIDGYLRWFKKNIREIR